VPPGTSGDLDPHATELLLFIQVEMYRRLTGGITDAMKVFLTYAAATSGKAAFAAVSGDVLARVSEAAAGSSKREFYALCTEAIKQERPS
jgi:hypothetical protein